MATLYVVWTFVALLATGGVSATATVQGMYRTQLECEHALVKGLEKHAFTVSGGCFQTTCQGNNSENCGWPEQRRYYE